MFDFLIDIVPRDDGGAGGGGSGGGVGGSGTVTGAGSVVADEGMERDEDDLEGDEGEGEGEGYDGQEEEGDLYSEYVHYEGIRKSAVGALFQYIKTMYELSEAPEWQPGAKIVSVNIVSSPCLADPSQAIPLHEHVKSIVNLVLPPIFETWKTEDDQ